MQTRENRLTVTEASQRAATSPDRILRRLRSGELAGEYFAGRWAVDAVALARWMEREASQSDQNGANQ